MAEYRITCITKKDRLSKHEHITHVGNSSWTPKTRTREKVIELISEGHKFYVTDSKTGKTSYVGIVREKGKAPFLRTHADGYWNDNLLSLPEC